MRETDLQAMIRLDLGKRAPHTRLLRNNTGIAVHSDGSRVVYGCGGPGGADLLGWSTVTVTPEMVGTKVALFVAMEIKTESGRVTKEQAHFLSVVRAAGGIADVVRSPDDALRLVGVR